MVDPTDHSLEALMARGSIETLPSGRHRARAPGVASRTFTRKRDAEAWLARAIADAERGVGTASREPLSVLIRPWWAAKERAVKPRTAERYRHDLAIIEGSVIAKVPLRLVDLDKVQAFVDGLSPQYAPATIRGVYGVLAMILNHGAQRGKLHPISRPMLPSAAPRELTVPTRAQVEQLAEASDRRLYAPVILSGYTGLRQGELLALHRADVHLDEGWLLIRHARNKTSGAFESTKSGKARRLFLERRVVETLREHLDEYPGELVIPTTASILSKSWVCARKGCKLEAVRFHDLRHAAASMMIDAGLNILVISRQLGHANPSITLNIYGHLMPDAADDAIRRLDAAHG
jgi:integrase